MSKQANLYFKTQEDAMSMYDQLVIDPYESVYPPRKISQDCWVIVRTIYSVRD